MKIVCFLVLLFGNFAVGTRIPIELESEIISKRQTLNSKSTNQNQTGITLDPFICSPAPVAVKVPLPAFWPRHVKLWRCMGSVYAIDLFKCGMKKEDHLLLKVMLDPSDNNFSGLVSMTNHTECTEKCFKKEKDCNTSTHILDPNACQCMCRGDFQCGPLKTWDTSSCKCICKSLANACPGYAHTKIWNDNTCKCECQDKLVKKCQNFGKVIDPNTCNCLCPSKTCPKGQVFQQASCKCVVSAV